VRHHERSLSPFGRERGVSHSTVRTAIIVPKTLHDRPVSEAEFQRRIKETEKFLAEKQGGFTEVNAKGGWVEHGRVIEEPTAEVVSYAKPSQVRASRADIRAFVKSKRRAWQQTAVSYEFDRNSGVYFVDKDFEKKKS
jgi:hypothetical protein